MVPEVDEQKEIQQASGINGNFLRIIEDIVEKNIEKHFSKRTIKQKKKILKKPKEPAQAIKWWYNGKQKR